MKEKVVNVFNDRGVFCWYCDNVGQLCDNSSFISAYDLPVWLLQFLRGWIWTEICMLSERRNLCMLLLFNLMPHCNQRSNGTSHSLYIILNLNSQEISCYPKCQNCVTVNFQISGFDCTKYYWNWVFSHYFFHTHKK